MERREKEKERKVEKKRQLKIKEARIKTRTSIWRDAAPKVHVHTFSEPKHDEERDVDCQVCTECGLEIVVDVF